MRGDPSDWCERYFQPRFHYWNDRFGLDHQHDPCQAINAVRCTAFTATLPAYSGRAAARRGPLGVRHRSRARPATGPHRLLRDFDAGRGRAHADVREYRIVDQIVGIQLERVQLLRLARPPQSPRTPAKLRLAAQS
jgi:hypothetical protein